MGVSFMWSSEDVDTGRVWLEKFLALGQVLMSTVNVTKIPEWLDGLSSLAPKAEYGSGCTHNIRKISSKMAGILGNYLERMPSNPGAMLSFHQLRGKSASPDPKSVFGTREPHFMVEILGLALIEDNREDTVRWANEVWEAINRSDEDIILPTAYISVDLPSSGQIPLSRIYGSNGKEVLSLKDQYDRDNFFDLAVPILANYI